MFCFPSGGFHHLSEDGKMPGLMMKKQSVGPPTGAFAARPHSDQNNQIAYAYTTACFII
jgi:hypothetical protein